MEMTAPVLVKIPEETKMWEPAVYTLNFPLPAAYQDEPPAPTNDKVSCAGVGLAVGMHWRVRSDLPPSSITLCDVRRSCRISGEPEPALV